MLAQRAILDEEVLLDYARDEGLIDDDDERTLKPCTVRAIIRHTGLSMEGVPGPAGRRRRLAEPQPNAGTLDKHPRGNAVVYTQGTRPKS